GEAEHQVPGRAYAPAAPVTYHREQHRVEVLHGDRAAPPYVPVPDLTGERVHRPLVRVRRYHVEGPVYQQRPPGRVGAFEPGHHAGPTGLRLEDPRFQADLGELARDVLGGDPLPGTGRQVTGVGGVDPDQLMAQLDNLVRHPPFIPAHGLIVRRPGYPRPMSGAPLPPLPPIFGGNESDARPGGLSN